MREIYIKNKIASFGESEPVFFRISPVMQKSALSVEEIMTQIDFMIGNLEYIKDRLVNKRRLENKSFG
jgi:hypothetical protein